MKLLNFIFLLLLIPAAAFAQNGKETIDRSMIPEAGPAPSIQLGKYETFVLDNGLKVFVVENHKIPRVAFSLVLDNDPVLEGKYTGYIDVTGELLRTGTKNRSKDQIDEEIDFIGASLSTSAGGISASCLTRHKDKVTEIMSDIILNAQFDMMELEKIKKRLKSSLASQKDDPEAIAANVSSVLLYGRGHPYGELMTEESIENISIDKCNDYYQTFFRPNKGYLAVVGDINVEEAKTLINKHLGAWEKRDVQDKEYKTPEAPAKRRVCVVDKAGAVQSVIKVTYPVDLKPGDPDVIKARVMNTILGGGSSFRLFDNLREKHGYTYGAYSSLSSDELAGSFEAYAEVRNEVTDSAVTEIFHELNRIRNEKIDQDELIRAKNYISGGFGRSLEDPATIARFAINTQRYQLPPDYYETYLKKVEAVAVNDVQQMAQKYIKPDHAYLLAVGNVDEIGEKLKKISPGSTIEEFDMYGYPVERKDMKIPEGVTAETVIESYIKAIGGRKVLEKVDAVSMEMTGSISGQSFKVVNKSKAPNLAFLEITVNGMTFQKEVFDGEKAKATSIQGSKMIEGEELEELKYRNRLNPELKYKELGYKLELQGMKEIDGKKAYVLDIISPAESKLTEYFDMETGLKLKTIRTMETPMGEVSQTTDYHDYKPVDKVLFPHKMVQSAGPQHIELKINTIEVNPKLKKSDFKVE